MSREVLTVSDELVDAERLAELAEVPSHSDLDLVRRLVFLVVLAERALGLPFNVSGVQLGVRIDRVVERARAGRLDPGLYRACWLLRSWLRADVPAS